MILVTDETCTEDPATSKIKVGENEVYKGSATHTRNNVECVKWSSFSNGFSNAENNICIMNGEDAPWCYIKTQKTGAYWDYCSCAMKQG